MVFQTGVYVSNKGVRIVENIEIPTPGDDEVLIKNIAVAANPKDWKVPDIIPTWDEVEGSDVAGYVESVGKNVQEFKKGDKVAAFSKMAVSTAYGAYQQYTLAPATTTFPLGPKTSFEAASTLPLAFMTAAIALFANDQLGLPEPPVDGHRKPVDPGNKRAIIIYGAGTSVGCFAVQLAKQAGLFVIAIAGASSHLAKHHGADVVLNYRDHATPEDLASAALSSQPDRSIDRAFDTISEAFTVQTCLSILSRSGGGVLSTVSGDWEKELPTDSVRTQRTMVGTAHAMFSEYGENVEFARRWYRLVGKWVEEGKFEANVVKLMPNGLKSVEEGLKLLKERLVRGEKLVYRLSDTPEL